jgi:hypothetical protein
MRGLVKRANRMKRQLQIGRGRWPATEALKRLKRRSSAPDKFVVIRDNFAFHHPSLDDVEAAFQLMANAMGDLDVNEAHRKLLGDIAPIANDLSTFAFGFAEAIFIKHFGELTATRVAEIGGAANIEDLRLPWFVETTNSLPS